MIRRFISLFPASSTFIITKHKQHLERHGNVIVLPSSLKKMVLLILKANKSPILSLMGSEN